MNCKFFSKNTTYLNEAQKVYLSYYLIIKNILYIKSEIKVDIKITEIDKFFKNSTTIYGGYSLIFIELLISMTYPKSKIKK